MSTPRAAPNPLARIRFELSPGWTRRRRVASGALVVAALLAGAAGSHLYWSARTGFARSRDAALAQLPPLQRALEQAHLQLRVSEARGHELERQFDELNRRLRECQDEIIFFRKARDGKR